MGVIRITQSVGRHGANKTQDVRLLQTLLNQNLFKLIPLAPLEVDGACGPLTVGLICEFQRRALHFSPPDGRVDPDGKTLSELSKHTQRSQHHESAATSFSYELLKLQQWVNTRTPKPHIPQPPAKSLTEEDYIASARDLGAEPAIIKALALVESRGGGFLSNGKPKILFEGHWFHKFTNGKYDNQHPTISYAQWTKAHYAGGAKEYSRYNLAYTLNQEAAMKSTSWGKFQIMGFNYEHSGYSSVKDFVADMRKSEGHHLKALVQFIKSRGISVFLKNKQWSKFASAYNGPRYAENQYHTKLEKAYKSYAGH